MSDGIRFDQAYVKVKNPNWFVSAATGLPLNTSEPSFDIFPRQIRSNEDLDSFITQAMVLSELMHAAVIVTIGWLWWTSGNPYQLIFGFYAVQLLSSIPKIYDFNLPASAVVIVSYFKDLVEFELLNVETVVRWFVPDFSFYGWWSVHDPSLNHKDQLFAFFDEWQFWIFLPILLGLVFIIIKIVGIGKPKSVKKPIRRMKTEIFSVKGFIKILLMIYLKCCISVGVQIKMYINGAAYSNWVSQAFSYLLAVIVVGLPLLLIWGLKQILKFGDNKLLRKQLGFLYSELHIFKHRRSIMYFPVFLLRRLVLVLVPTLIPFQGLQMQGLTLLTLAGQWWYFDMLAHNEQQRRMLEVVNESLVLAFIYLLILVSDFNQNLDFQYSLGYGLGIVLAIIVAANILAAVIERISSLQRLRQTKERQEMNRLLFI